MWHKISQTVSKEFETVKLSLSYGPVDDFFKCQWQKQKKSIWWLIYRWCLAVFFLTGTINIMIRHWLGGIWWIYFTDWGLVMCTATCLFGATLVSIWHLNSSFLEEGCTIVKFYWAMHWSTLVLSAWISLVYWIFLLPFDPTNATKWFNLYAHAFNSILMTMDHMLVAFPTRLFHFVYPLTVAMCYLIFSFIYYFAGGVNFQGNRYIYPILDWSEPGQATLTVCGCAIFLILLSFFMFALFKLRCYLFERKTNEFI